MKHLRHVPHEYQLARRTIKLIDQLYALHADYKRRNCSPESIRQVGQAKSQLQKALKGMTQP